MYSHADFRLPFAVECGVSALFGFILFAQRHFFLRIPHLGEYYLGASLAEINHFAGLHSSPMKLGVCTTFAMAVWKFFTGLRSFPCATTVRPPAEGSTLHSDHHDFLAHGRYMVTTLSMEAFWTS